MTNNESSLNSQRLRLPQWLKLLLISPLIFLNGWILIVTVDYFQSLITTFIAASLLAFMINYPTQALERLNVPRGYAVLLIFLIGLSGISLILFFSFPFLLRELDKLANRVPSWVESANIQLTQLANWTNVELGTWTANFQELLSNELESWLVRLPEFALGTVSNLFQILLIVILTIFFAISCQSFLRQTIRSSLPSGPRILQLLNQNFHRYLVNQLTLATLIALTMIPTFWLLNVPFAVLFGLSIGIMGLIPFCAILSIWLVSFLLALKSIWLGIKVLIIALLIDQIIENTVTPRLLGSLTGLNPILVLFSLMVGAKVAGYLGILVAVPVTATINALVTSSLESNSKTVNSVLPESASSWEYANQNQ